MSKNSANNISFGMHNLRNRREIAFVNKIYDSCNSKYMDVEIENQITAIKRVIEYIKYRKESGATIEEIDNEVLKFIFLLSAQISTPDLISFYRMRTFEYMDGLDLEPYVKAIIDEKIDVDKYAKKHENDFSANLEGNIRIQLCELISEFTQVNLYSANEEINCLCGKIEKNELDPKDLNVVMKYLRYYWKELKISRYDDWEKMKKNPEKLRKLLIKHINDIFEVEEVTISHKSRNIEVDEDDDIENLIKNLANQTKETSMRTDMKMLNVKLKGVKGNPFIGSDETNNFLIYANILFSRMCNSTKKSTPEELLAKIYTIIKHAATEKNPMRREQLYETIDEWFPCIYFGKNDLHMDEKLLKRLTALMDFFNSNGLLEKFCTTNNTRLQKIKLPELQIDSKDLYEKFIFAEKDKRDLVYLRDFDEGKFFYDRCYINTPVHRVSQESLIAMSSFYINRLAKEALPYGRVKYIFDQQNIIQKIYENPDIKFDDLELDDKTLVLYMSMYDELHSQITQLYIDNLPDHEEFDDQLWLLSIKYTLKDIKDVYENYFKTNSCDFDFQRDVRNVMYGAVISRFIYDLKEFSVNSLMYTALTDKKKNIINWGYVPEDENEDNNMILIGFDIKLLNMPVYVHMVKDEVIDFLEETTGDTKIPIYEGADDMYNYKLKKRLTTQVLYPVSKEERKKLLKVDGIAKDDRTYQHLRWLQQPNNPPSSKYAPGTRFFDLETGEVVKVPKNAETGNKNCKDKCKGNKSNTKRTTPSGQNDPGDSNR